MDYDKILKLAEQFYSFAKNKDYITLYHISKHGPGMPHPCGWREEGWLRERQIKDPIASGIFLSPDPLKVWKSHGRHGNIHVYNISKQLIHSIGGINYYFDAPEIIIPEDVWNKGLHNGDIIYEGKMSERKFSKKENEMKPIVTRIQQFHEILKSKYEQPKELFYHMIAKLQKREEDKKLGRNYSIGKIGDEDSAKILEECSISELNQLVKLFDLDQRQDFKNFLKKIVTYDYSGVVKPTEMAKIRFKDLEKVLEKTKYFLGIL